MEKLLEMKIWLADYFSFYHFDIRLNDSGFTSVSIIS